MTPTASGGRFTLTIAMGPYVNLEQAYRLDVRVYHGPYLVNFLNWTPIAEWL